MHTAKVIYHYEPDGWWAESPNFPGFTAVGESFNEVRVLTHEGLLAFCGEKLYLVEILPPLKSVIPLTSGSTLESEPPKWTRRRFTRSKSDEQESEGPARTTSSDEVSEDKERSRNLVFG